MMQDEFQDSNSSSDDNAELVIKPPQISAGSNSVFCQNEKKKRKHLREHKSRKKHHHCHKVGHVRSVCVDSSNGNQNFRENKGKERSKVSKINFTEQDMIDSKSKKLINNVFHSERKSNKCEEITDMRHTKSVKDIRKSMRYSYKSQDRNAYFLEEMKIEWRHKRLQWLQHQKKQDEKLRKERETVQSKNGRELNKQYQNTHPEYSRSKISSTDCLQHDEEINYSIMSSGSSSEENLDNKNDQKSKKLINEENEYVSDHEDTVSISDISNNDNDASSESEEESVEIEYTSENEKDVSQKETLPTEPATITVTTGSFKKENLNTKPTEKNEIAMVSPEKCLSLASTNAHPPKFAVYCPAIQGCRSVDGFQVLNRIEEGTYGVVYRAKDKETNEIVALKRLKMEREKEGFPITSLREINTLLKAQHPNIVTVREIVVGSHMDRIYIVMDYVEHDLKSLMKIMPRPFLIGEVKTLLMQLLCAVAHLHDNWILHRDLKTSNLLLSHEGILKVGDFGLAREYGSPLRSYTPVVVTLWYRAPELLLGAKKYSTPIDMWSVGCIFGELMIKNALFPGKSESDQLNRIFKDLGSPNENIWPGYSELPLVKSINITQQHPYNVLKNRFSQNFTDLGFDLLNKFLTYNPARRISAEDAKKHEYFAEKPSPTPPNMFPTWPAKSERDYRTKRSNLKPPLNQIHYSRQ